MQSTKTNKPYRVETRTLHNKNTVYYLVKDIKINNTKIKIQKYIGRTKPTEKELQQLTEQYALEIEQKALQKIVTINSKSTKTKYLDKTTTETLETLYAIYKKLKQVLTIDEIRIYEQDFEIKYIHGTTAIEGNTLTKQETHDLLINEVLPNKSLREVNEVQNFRKVKEYRDKYKGKITVEFIKELHTPIMNNIDHHSLGNFRRIDNIVINGCDLSVAPAELIEEELTKIINEYYTALDNGNHPFEEAAMFHYNFEMIHPFTDGNGRVGREIFNYMLNKNKYPKLLFLGSEKQDYIKILKLGNEGKYQEMVIKFAQLIITQRLSALSDNLVKILVPAKKTAQLKIQDFFV